VLEEEGVGVDARDAGSPQCEPVRDPAVPARDVEHLVPCLEPEQRPDQLRLPVRELVGEEALVEVEVVLAEHLRRHVIHAASSQLASEV
jgi:hypothetical protein